jgi:hypothetical protein
MVEVKVDASDCLKSIEDLPKRFKKKVTKALQKELTAVQMEARQTHRFQKRTGDLQRAIHTGIDPSELSGEVYIDDDWAPYGVFVVDGHGTWEPDPFLDDALDKKSNEIDDAINNAIDEAIIEAGF